MLHNMFQLLLIG